MIKKIEPCIFPLVLFPTNYGHYNKTEDEMEPMLEHEDNINQEEHQ